MYRSENHSPLLMRQTAFDEFEERLVLSAQPLGDFFIDDSLMREVQTNQVDLAAAATDVHQATGVNYARQQYGLTGAGQTVVVIDSGIAYDHVALGGGYGPGYQVVGGWDFTEENDANPYDDGPAGFHGTHVAGIIGSNSSLHPGVSPGVDLVALRVFNDQGAGYFTWVENALSWVHQNRNAFANPITTVNLSLGTEWNSDTIPSWATLEDELKQLYQDGIVVTVSAGNSFASFNAPGLSYPAVSQYVIPVASVDDAGALSYFSQRNSRVIAAPGERITSTVPDHIYGSDGNPNDWAAASGTSMASPYVAGASTLLREAMEIAGRSGITKDTIYEHLRQTADTFFDSVTNANYLRLNVGRAIDTLLGTDDYGSTAATAHKLGDVFGTSRIDGVIGSLKDTDYFTFTASASGKVSLNWTATHELTPVVTVDGVVVHTDSTGKGPSFEIVAGRSYSISMATQAGVGRYTLQLVGERAAPATNTPRDLGAVDLRTVNLTGSVGDVWYRVQANRSGILTAEATDVSNAVKVEFYAPARNGQQPQRLVGAVSSQSGTRVDLNVKAGDAVLVRLSGAAGKGTLRIANLIGISERAAAVYGTSGDDTFEIQTGATQHVRINGLAYSFNASQFTDVRVDGRGGVDTATVQGTIGNETVTTEPGRFTLQAGGYRVSSTDIENLTLYAGGGVDRVVAQDSTANDLLEADGLDVRLSGPNFSTRLVGFADVSVNSTAGGRDRATIRDSIGNDRVDIGLGSVSMSAGGLVIRINGFDQIQAYATRGGFDRVVFHDSAGNDTLTATETYASLSGNGYYSYAEGFERVVADSTAGGSDRAYLYDTPGDDVFRATPSSALLEGATVTYEVQGFSQVIAAATAGGFDRAYLHDSAGNDTLTSKADDLSLAGSGYSTRARGFDEAYAYAVNGGRDAAVVHDAVPSQQQAGGAELTIRGAGYTHFIHGFADVRQASAGQPTAQPQTIGIAAEQLFADAAAPRLASRVQAVAPSPQTNGANPSRAAVSDRSVEALAHVVNETWPSDAELHRRLSTVATRTDGHDVWDDLACRHDATRGALDELAHLDELFDELAADD